MQHLLVDFVNPQGNRAFTTSLDKINFNVKLIPSIKESIDGQKKTRLGAFSTITVFGL
ncbi:MAG: hypothetical protein ABIR18_06605 [Chitinophagaceae bacterium]